MFNPKGLEFMDFIVTNVMLPKEIREPLDMKAQFGSLVEMEKEKFNYDMRIINDNEELELGVSCMAAGIYDDSGRMVAGLSLSAPTDRLQKDWGKPLIDTALQISRGIGFKLFLESKSLS
jgi:asparagine synthetase A